MGVVPDAYLVVLEQIARLALASGVMRLVGVRTKPGLLGPALVVVAIAAHILTLGGVFTLA